MAIELPNSRNAHRVRFRGDQRGELILPHVEATNRIQDVGEVGFIDRVGAELRDLLCRFTEGRDTGDIRTGIVQFLPG